MSQQTARRPQYRSKEEERSRFGFEYVKANINYRTEIPPLPEKPRHKPDEKVLDKKVEELQGKIAAVKEARREKKEEIKAANRAYDEKIEQIKRKVDLGRKCIEVLYSDLDFFSDSISRVIGKIRSKQFKLEDNADLIRRLKAQAKPAKRSYKKLQEMTIRQLDAEKARIEYDMSSGDLSKKEEVELSAQINKIGRIRADTTRNIPADAPQVDTSGQVAVAEAAAKELREAVEKHRVEKEKLVAQKEEVDWKIHCIREDLTQFIAEIKQIAEEEESNQQSKALYDQSKALKQQIYDLRDQIAQAEKDFKEKTQEYEYEQEKIRWTAWATKIQEEKREEWEAEKAERKRQKLREKEKGDGKKEGDGKTAEQAKPEQREERKRPNRNQKEIDNCAFLIDYCKRLYPSAASRAAQAQKKAVNLDEELKKGAWAKEKGVQIIQSKKAKRDEEETVSRPARKQNEVEEEAQPGKFTHDYFVQKFFDNAKIIPPTGVEELEKIIKELEDKVEYYISHPDEGVESKFEQDRKYVDKYVKPETASKYTKAKPGRVINTEDFPSLA